MLMITGNQNSLTVRRKMGQIEALETRDHIYFLEREANTQLWHVYHMGIQAQYSQIGWFSKRSLNLRVL